MPKRTVALSWAEYRRITGQGGTILPPGTPNPKQESLAMTTHTPGPAMTADGIAWMLGIDKPTARAMALAPAMLEALREYVEAEERAAPYSSSPLREKARAIFAQVDGKE